MKKRSCRDILLNQNRHILKSKIMPFIANLVPAALKSRRSRLERYLDHQPGALGQVSARVQAKKL
jgi:hypothetical protein